MSLPTPAPEIIDAAINAVAVASVAYHAELVAFRHIVATALTHGLPVRQVADAAGLTCAQVAKILAGAPESQEPSTYECDICGGDHYAFQCPGKAHQ